MDVAAAAPAESSQRGMECLEWVLRRRPLQPREPQPGIADDDGAVPARRSVARPGLAAGHLVPAAVRARVVRTRPVRGRVGDRRATRARKTRVLLARRA